MTHLDQLGLDYGQVADRTEKIETVESQGLLQGQPDGVYCLWSLGSSCADECAPVCSNDANWVGLGGIEGRGFEDDQKGLVSRPSAQE